MILFPAIAKSAVPANLAAPIRAMVMEHEHSGNDLADMRLASANYTPPRDACAIYRVLYQGLAEFDANLRQHIHLENNILFPRAQR
jgi:regulator of cell morphogenesis and NO signaling